MSRISYLLGLAAAILVGIASLAQAQFPTWNVSSGNWSVLSNWINGAPTSYAYINNGGTCTIDSTDGTVKTLDLYAGTSAGSGWLDLNAGGALSPPSSSFIIEELGVAANSGVFTQTGGINCPYQAKGSSGYNELMVGYSNGGYGEYDLSGGSVGANAIFVNGNPTSGTQNGTGTFTQTGGSIGAFIPGGTNQAIGIFVGGSWASKPFGGETGVGSYSLQSGLIVGGCETVGGDGTGTFTQSGGTNAFIGNGDYNSTSMTDYNSHIGALLIGLRGTSTKGYGQGTYNLYGGLLTGVAPAGVNSVDGEELIGASGTATFNQTGGTNNCHNYFNLAAAQGSSFNWGGGGQGFYNLSGTGLLMGAVYEYVGGNGTGIFTQTGGTNATSHLSVGGYHGVYNLNGGLLQLSSNLTINTSGTFNFTAGTIQASGALALPSLSGAATIDMNGHQVTLQQLVTNSGLTDLNFADPTTGNDLLTIGSGGWTVNPNTSITFNNAPGVADIGNSYELIAGTLGTPASYLSNFTLPTNVPGVSYSLAVGTDGNIYLDVAAVPEPGTLALLAAGLMSLLAFAWRRRNAG